MRRDLIPDGQQILRLQPGLKSARPSPIRILKAANKGNVPCRRYAYSTWAALSKATPSDISDRPLGYRFFIDTSDKPSVGPRRLTPIDHSTMRQPLNQAIMLSPSSSIRPNRSGSWLLQSKAAPVIGPGQDFRAHHRNPTIAADAPSSDRPLASKESACNFPRLRSCSTSFRS